MDTTVGAILAHQYCPLSSLWLHRGYGLHHGYSDKLCEDEEQGNKWGAPNLWLFLGLTEWGAPNLWPFLGLTEWGAPDLWLLLGLTEWRAPDP